MYDLERFYGTKVGFYKGTDSYKSYKLVQTSNFSFKLMPYLTLINWAILCKVTFVGYPWVPSRGPADFFSDTVLFWEWIRHHHWIRQPWFSALSYLTLVNWAILCKVTFVGYPWDPSLGPADFFRTLSCSESELDITIGFGYLDLVHFHTSHL